MRILLTGANGQLGWEILRQAPQKAFDCVGIDIEQADLTDPEQVRAAIADTHPDLLINAAAYTLVDAAESDTRMAYAVNRDAAAHLAAACAAVDIPMVHVSTDFVFDGAATEPYTETDPIAPLGVYGQSKADGEAAVRDTLARHIIIRTAWLYGIHGNNFVKTMLRLARQKQTLRVVSDQIGCPTYAADLAGALLTICGHIEKRAGNFWGTYHYCGSGSVSWHGFAMRILRSAHDLGLVPAVAVLPIPSADYPTPAPRPAFAALACDKIRDRFGIDCPPWDISLENMLIRLAKRTPETG
jgi:dTDP-4-dehydrorhamnose reductase